MSRQREPEFPDDLRPVEERLRRGRAEISSLELGRLKRRVLAQSAAHGRKPSVIWSRIVAAGTAIVLLGGAGGAIALSGMDSHPNNEGGAAEKQYHHHKHCTHRHHPGQKCKGVKGGKGHGQYGHKKHHQANKHVTGHKGHFAYGPRKGSRHHHHHHHHHATHPPRRRRGFTG